MRIVAVAVNEYQGWPGTSPVEIVQRDAVRDDEAAVMGCCVELRGGRGRSCAVICLCVSLRAGADDYGHKQHGSNGSAHSGLLEILSLTTSDTRSDTLRLRTRAIQSAGD